MLLECLNQGVLPFTNTGSKLSYGRCLHKSDSLTNSHISQFGRCCIKLNKIWFQRFCWTSNKSDVSPLVGTFFIVVWSRKYGQTLQECKTQLIVSTYRPEINYEDKILRNGLSQKELRYIFLRHGYPLLTLLSCINSYPSGLHCKPMNIIIRTMFIRNWACSTFRISNLMRSNEKL